MLSSSGTFETTNASKFLQQLCKHFAHKVHVEYNETKGTAALPAGEASLLATPVQLLIVVQGETSEDLEKAKSIVDVHLERFAFREKFKQMNWTNGQQVVQSN